MRSQIALLMILAGSLAAQQIESASIGGDKRVHLQSNSKTHIIAFESDQVGVQDLRIAPDHQTVGWTVLQDNCCTSYPVTTRLVIYRNGHKLVLTNGQCVDQWQFQRHGDRVAVLFAPTHGNATEAALFDTRTGKRLATWNRGDAPGWADDWRDVTLENNAVRP